MSAARLSVRRQRMGTLRRPAKVMLASAAAPATSSVQVVHAIKIPSSTQIPERRGTLLASPARCGNAGKRGSLSSIEVSVHEGSVKDHGHAHHEATIFGQVVAGAICFLLYFFFCVVFSAVIFKDLILTTSFGIGQGVGIVMLGIGVGCLSFASPWGSGCNVILAGPDLLPIIFAQECGDAIVGFLDGKTPEKAIPTTLVAMIFGNVLVGVLFFGLGRAKKTAAAVGFVPASVIAGFLSCIGYKVIKLAVFVGTTYEFKWSYRGKLFATYDEKVDPYIPVILGIFIGVPLYMAKRRHICKLPRVLTCGRFSGRVSTYATAVHEHVSSWSLALLPHLVSTPRRREL